MRKQTISLAVVVIIALSGIGATIKFFTDYANSIPVGSDFFVLQRNQSYINSSVSQVKGDWFNNPVFTGNGSINGSFTANNYFGDGTALTGIASLSSVSNIVIAFSKDNTNFSLLIGANGTNFTLLIGLNDTNYVNQVSNQLYQSISSATNGGNFILSNNGNGTNTTNWGVSSFQEVDAQNFFATNLFTGLTNFATLGTDANGLLDQGMWLQSSKSYLKSNTIPLILGDISQTPTHVLHIFHTNAANNDVVGIDSTSSDSSSMFHIKNRTAQGPFFDYEAANVRWGFGISSGNNFVLRTGPNAADPVNGSTVITMTTNGDMTVRGFTNLQTSASQFKITDSFNGEQTTLDGSSLTNLSYAYKIRTDIGNGVVTFGQGIFTNISADRTLASFTYGLIGANGYETAIIGVTNSDTAVHTLTMPANVIGKPGKTAPGVFYITNGVCTQISVAHMMNLFTNATTDF